MQLRKLYRTIESIASKNFEKEEDLLRNVLHEIVQNDEINIKGGRTWRFDAKTGSYELLHQIGDMEHIKPHYRIKVKVSDIRTIRGITANCGTCSALCPTGRPPHRCTN